MTCDRWKWTTYWLKITTLSICRSMAKAILQQSNQNWDVEMLPFNTFTAHLYIECTHLQEETPSPKHTYRCCAGIDRAYSHRISLISTFVPFNWWNIRAEKGRRKCLATPRAQESTNRIHYATWNNKQTSQHYNKKCAAVLLWQILRFLYDSMNSSHLNVFLIIIKNRVFREFFCSICVCTEANMQFCVWPKNFVQYNERNIFGASFWSYILVECMEHIIHFYQLFFGANCDLKHRFNNLNFHPFQRY